jgi:O-antigen ligase
LLGARRVTPRIAPWAGSDFSDPSATPNRLTRLLLGALMVLPWLAPWSPSPLPNTVPLLVSWACVAGLLLLGQRLTPLDIARAWAIAALLSSVLGLIQYFGAAEAFSPWLHVAAMGEANANLRQRNQLATLLAIGILAVLWWHSQGLRCRHALWMLALLAVGNAATTSRTGLLHMLLVLGCVALWAINSRETTPQLSWRLAGWALVVYLMANWALPWALSGLSGQDVVDALRRMGHNEGCGSRRVLWANVLELIGQKPWTGWGWGELKYAHYITAYSGTPAQRFCDILGNAHNLPLHLAVTLGLPITALLGLAVLGWVVKARPWKSQHSNHQLAWSVMAVIGLHSLLEFPLWYGPFQMAVLLCGVLCLPPSRQWRPRVEGGLQLLGGLVLAWVCWVGADYAQVRQIYLPAAQRWPVWREDPLGAARNTRFFQHSATFAALSLTRLTPENAPWVLATSLDMLHHSPEPQVVRQLLLSAQLLGRQDLVQLHTARWQAAFPTLPLPGR